MDSKDLKKVLAGLCITGLLAGAVVPLAGCSTGGQQQGASGSSSG